jgi:hypothetical protein
MRSPHFMRKHASPGPSRTRLNRAWGEKSERDVAIWQQVTGLRTRQAKTTVDVKFMQLDHVSDWLPRPEAVESPLLCTLSNYVSPDETVLDVIFLDLPKYKTHTYNQVIPRAPLPNVLPLPTNTIKNSRHLNHAKTSVLFSGSGPALGQSSTSSPRMWWRPSSRAAACAPASTTSSGP